MSTKYTIPDHWDTDGYITAESDPELEFYTWSDYAASRGSGWHGSEFCLADFERYIESLKQP